MSDKNDYNNDPLNPPVQESDESFDRPFCLAELSAVILGILGTLILLSGLGFYTVNPPGEADLCKVSTLGLENRTKSDQDFTLGTCHALYGGVFNMLKTISVPFILCGGLALFSAHLVFKGIKAAPVVEDIHGHFRGGICANIVGLVMVAVPALIFPSATAIVSAGLAPIHAYFITIMVAHFSIELSGAGGNESSNDPAVKAAAQTYETLYLGYCAASRTELCLFIGSTCMMVLVWAYLFDIVRSIGFMFIQSPNYNAQGSQLYKSATFVRKMKERLCFCFTTTPAAGLPAE